MNQETLQVLIEEVARVALEEWDIRERIGHELGAEEAELQEVLAYLESKLFPQTGGSVMELGYGHIVDQKLLDLGLSDRQLDYFLKHMHEELDVNQLVQLFFEVAPADVIESVADGIGVFELGDGEDDE
jgi:hypothetical protein